MRAHSPRPRLLIALALTAGFVLVGVAALQGAAAAPRARAATLRQLAAPLHRWIGTAVDTSALAQNPTYAKAVAREFSSVTPENVMKWTNVEPARGVQTYAEADRLVAFARKQGEMVRGHALVWHNQLPSWLGSGHFTKAELAQLLEKHVKAEVSHFRGEVYAWDVVNEPLNDDGSLRVTIWEQALGPGYIAKVLEWAHEADPKAKLYLNDYGIEGLGAKSDAMLDLVKGLLAKHVPLDGVGFESHLDIQYPFPTAMAKNLQRFAALGLDVALTEADVRVTLPASKAALATQAAYYRQLMQACLAVKRCVSFTVWGFTDRYSWVPGWFSGEGAATLFDARFRPKPAYAALRKLLAGR
jgi:endo-1,4-beta-xylanase